MIGKYMDMFLEILNLTCICLASLIALFACAAIQYSFMTEQEIADQADFMDEFLYGENFR